MKNLQLPNWPFNVWKSSPIATRTCRLNLLKSFYFPIFQFKFMCSSVFKHFKLYQVRLCHFVSWVFHVFHPAIFSYISDQILLKPGQKQFHWLKSKNKFNKEIYSRRNNFKSIFNIIKRRFNGTIRSRSLQLSNNETKFKIIIYNIYSNSNSIKIWFLQSLYFQ